MQKVADSFFTTAIAVSGLFLFIVLLMSGCQSSDTRGMCRDFEVCTVYEGQPEDCDNLRIWFECDPENEEACEWQELDTERTAPNDETVPCEQCDHRQCPEN